MKLFNLLKADYIFCIDLMDGYPFAVSDTIIKECLLVFKNITDDVIDDTDGNDADE